MLERTQKFRAFPGVKPQQSIPQPVCFTDWNTRKLYIYVYTYIQSVSRLVDITAGGDFLGLCNQKGSYKHVSDFGRLRSYDRLKLRIEGNDY